MRMPQGGANTTNQSVRELIATESKCYKFRALLSPL